MGAQRWQTVPLKEDKVRFQDCTHVPSMLPVVALLLVLPGIARYVLASTETESYTPASMSSKNVWHPSRSVNSDKHVCEQHREITADPWECNNWDEHYNKKCMTPGKHKCMSTVTTGERHNQVCGHHNQVCVHLLDIITQGQEGGE